MRTTKDGECRIWCGSLSTTGYPKIGVDGKTKKTHRVAYELQFGPIPEGHDLHHTCENILCINPMHLMLSTRKQHHLLHNRERGEDGRFVPQVK